MGNSRAASEKMTKPEVRMTDNTLIKTRIRTVFSTEKDDVCDVLCVVDAVGKRFMLLSMSCMITLGSMTGAQAFFRRNVIAGPRAPFAKPSLLVVSCIAEIAQEQLLE